MALQKSNLEYGFSVNADFRSAPAVDDNNNIYIGSAELAMDATWGSPILSNSGILYISTMYIPGKKAVYEYNTGTRPNKDHISHSVYLGTL